MRFRRKQDQSDAPVVDQAEEAAEETAPTATPGPGPHDIADVDVEEGTRVDLGSLLIAPMQGTDLRVQVDERSGEVLSVMLLGQSGALEARAFAAPRNGGLWEDTRRQIAAEVERLGGTVDEREGPFGPELLVQQQVKGEDGQPAVQSSRVLGHEGPRWLLRTTLLGQPATDPEQAASWEDAIRAIVVRRGDEAMPPGEALSLVLPEGARREG